MGGQLDLEAGLLFVTILPAGRLPDQVPDEFPENPPPQPMPEEGRHA